MPKSKEFFSLLKEQGKISNPKFDELIEKIPDFEIADEAVSAFEEKFMTVSRATSHPEVTQQVRALALKPFNRDIEKIIATISEIDKPTSDKIQSLVQGSSPDTYKRMEVLSNSLGDLFNKVKTTPGDDEELKKELKKKEATIQEALDKLSNVQKEFTEREKGIKTDFENKLHEFKLDGELEKLAGTFTLAEAYEKNRRETNDIILTAVKKSNLLKLGSKDGQTIVQVLDENGEPRYNGNSPVTINQLLEEKYKPFLKQSNAEHNQQSKSRTVTVNGTKAPGRGVSTTVK